jgi:cation diffusion facilitator CzcD-associated flavoprotein CzcO
MRIYRWWDDRPTIGGMTMPTTQYKWAVIGAGPAGIAAIGRLLDHGVGGEHIVWLDPHFAAGDLGRKWRRVPSNTSVKTFLEYLYASPAFRFGEAPLFALAQADPAETCALDLVADPLVWVSDRLREQVSTIRTTVTDLRLHQRHWIATAGIGEIEADNVILAVGATPKKLDYPGLTEIALDVALDPDKLAQLPLDGATVAVFGSSHSSMIALPNLLNRPVANVVNFYRSPLRYAVEFDGWTLFDDIGLKGHAAAWAKENIDGSHPARLHRMSVYDKDFDACVRKCDHVVYTIGFERRPLPRTPQWGTLHHNPSNGIIAPGMFGFGIAFPECRADPLGFAQHRVGLRKFMEYLDTVLPIWLAYGT